LNVECHNPRCVTKTEDYLPRYFVPLAEKDEALFEELGDGEIVRCYYCDYEVSI